MSELYHSVASYSSIKLFQKKKKTKQKTQSYNFGLKDKILQKLSKNKPFLGVN